MASEAPMALHTYKFFTAVYLFVCSVVKPVLEKSFDNRWSKLRLAIRRE